MKKHEQDGAVSMLTVIFLSILLVLVTMAFIGSAVSEQRNATNADLSTRAYYAAQAGFEDAVRQIKTDLNAQPNPKTPSEEDKCAITSDYVYDGGKVAADDSGIDASYTCQLIGLESDRLTYDGLQPNDAVMFPIVPHDGQPPGAYYVRINWISSGSHLPSGDKSLLTADDWSANEYPVMLRAGLVWYWNQGKVGSRIHYLMPSESSLDSESINLPSDNGAPNAPSQPITNTTCEGPDGDGAYSCTADIKVDTKPRGYTPPSGYDTNGYDAANNKYDPAIKSLSGIINKDPLYQPNSSLPNYHPREYLPDGQVADNQYQLYVVTKSIYGLAKSVNLSLYRDSGGSPGDNIPLVGQITIDVTGKAGNVYRRIEQKIPYGEYQVRKVTFGNTPVPDFSIIGGDGICKMTFIGATEGDYQSADYMNECRP